MEKSKYKIDNEEEDCKKVREEVYSLNNTKGFPLVIKDMRQEYPAQAGDPPNVAVKCMNLLVHKGETFGLLGPNGAGKTTLISMVTGLFPSYAGNAWVG